MILFSILPADSLVFSAGIFAALGLLALGLMLLITLSATVLGDSINNPLGRCAGRPYLQGRSPIILSERMTRTESFFTSHGHNAVLFARFIPMVRALTPFLAGMALNLYRRFILFNVAGGFIWVSVFLFAGYFFGNVAFVRENLVLILLSVTAVSSLPAMLGIFGRKRGWMARI